MSRLYKTSVVLSLIGFIFALSGVITRGLHPEFFAWLFFYMPFLWALWICCVFFLRTEKKLSKLLSLWLLINLDTLLLFISFAIAVENWSHAKGIEIVVFTAYFPVVIPTAFLFNLVPAATGEVISRNFELLVKFFGGGAGDAFAIWLCMSSVAALQSLGLAGLSQLLLRRKNAPA